MKALEDIGYILDRENINDLLDNYKSRTLVFKPLYDDHYGIRLMVTQYGATKKGVLGENYTITLKEIAALSTLITQMEFIWQENEN